MSRTMPILAVAWACLAAASCASCALRPGTDLPLNGPATIKGTVASIDLEPWFRDGNAVVEVETTTHGRVAVQLPARWNLCRAPAVDIDAIAVGMRVMAVGEAAGGRTLVVCSGTGHRLVQVAASG